jgi:predicted O-linked N-acetylglucosamine transferase (SPINDLY family)
MQFRHSSPMFSHDKSRFELTGISIGPMTIGYRSYGSRLTISLKGVFSDQDIASELRARGLILVDAGITEHSRPAFAYRPRYSVNYRYPGTMGAGYANYIIASVQ